MNPYKKIFSSLHKNGIQYLIVGGVAVNLYGYARFTGDIDMLLMLDEPNLVRMERLMEKLGYIERLPVQLHELGDKKKVKKWLKEKGMIAYTFVSSKKPQLDIDILAGYSLEFKKFYKKRVTIKIWGVDLPVISIDDLLVMKKKAGRTQDIQDIKALLELKTLWLYEDQKNPLR
jgi:hypothetical protein